MLVQIYEISSFEEANALGNLGVDVDVYRCDCWKGSAMKIERHETGPRMSKMVIHDDTVYLRPTTKSRSWW